MLNTHDAGKPTIERKRTHRSGTVAALLIVFDPIRCNLPT
jgi:hypothetical protein